jgi:hypothetical protein
MNLVAQNAGAGSAFLTQSELDDFLFAPVFDDANGMTVSVLSMLARAGVDPRTKAAELARMTVGKATDALKSFIRDALRGLASGDDTDRRPPGGAAAAPHEPGRPGGRNQDRQYPIHAGACVPDRRDPHLPPDGRDLDNGIPAIHNPARRPAFGNIRGGRRAPVAAA